MARKSTTEFTIDTAQALGVSDEEITEILLQVFVTGGFVPAQNAAPLFAPCAVRSRGKLFGARAATDEHLVGMVIVVYPDSPARRIAQGSATEMHLLAVKPRYRCNGLGKMLVETALAEAREQGYAKMLLVTQPAMTAAHRLYQATGFVRVPVRDFHRGGIDFMAFETWL